MRQVVTPFYFFVIIALFFAFSTSAQDLSGLSFCIDAGHGLLSGSGSKEYTINLRVARILESYLKKANADTVILTVSENSEFLALSVREDIANLNGVDWFHSIHHTVFNDRIDFPLVLYLEIADQKTARWPGESDQMSEFMGANLSKAYQKSDYLVRGDYSFSGGGSGGKNLGILKNIQMPGELSEAAFIDNPGDAAKMKNDDFLHFEGIALFKSFLQYFDGGTLNIAPLGGFIYDKTTNLPINNAKIRTIPLSKTYKTDENFNGFYGFPGLQAKHYILEISATGYETIIDSITTEANEFNFLDFYLYPRQSTTVSSSIPINGETNFSPYGKIDFEFDRKMNVQSVQDALSIEPDFKYQISWNSENTKLQIDPSPILKFGTEYKVTIDTSAKDLYNYSFDGNSDGLSIDPFEYIIKTESSDMSVPQVLATYPVDLDSSMFFGQLVQIVFNKSINVASLNSDNIFIRESSGEQIPINIMNAVSPAGQGVVSLIPNQPFKPNSQYNVTIKSGISDSNQVNLEQSFQFSFFTEKSALDFTLVDNFEDGVSNWQNPKNSTRSRYFDPLKTEWTLKTDLILRDSLGAACLNYSLQADGLLDIPLTGNLEQYSNLQSEDEIGVYLYGDNSFTDFRFYFTDSSDGFEAGPWRNIDWYGWQVLRYCIGIDSVFAYEDGNGNFDGKIRLSGIQLKSNKIASGSLYFDDFFLLSSTITFADKDKKTKIPEEYLIVQSYPNPFSRKLNHSGVTITFEIPGKWKEANVNLSIFNTLGQCVRELVNYPHKPGRHEYFWNVSDEYNQPVPTGVYFYRVQTGTHIETRRITVFN